MYRCVCRHVGDKAKDVPNEGKDGHDQGQHGQDEAQEGQDQAQDGQDKTFWTRRLCPFVGFGRTFGFKPFPHIIYRYVQICLYACPR